MRRALLLLNLFLLAIALVAWLGSYYRAVSAGWLGYGVIIDSGGIYPLTPAVLTREGYWQMYPAGEFPTLEGVAYTKIQRWKPVRFLPTPMWGDQLIIAGWLPPLLLSVPLAIAWRRWRRDGGGGGGRGFEVAGGERGAEAR